MGVLANVLTDREPEVRLEGLSEIMLMSDDPPLELLAPMLDDPDPEVRLEVVRMISESEHPDADWLLRGALGDVDGDIREEAADALDVELDEEDNDGDN
jgi:HEAT repeat protein